MMISTAWYFNHLSASPTISSPY